MADPTSQFGPGEETERTGNSAGSGGAECDTGPHAQEQSDETSSVGLVVGVGASAGGLEAVSELLRNLPAKTGIAFVLVQHLDPHHKSIRN